jgi:hypothetical protein
LPIEAGRAIFRIVSALSRHSEPDKKQPVLTALDEANGSPVDEARLLGIHPNTCTGLIRNLSLKSEMKRLG